MTTPFLQPSGVTLVTGQTDIKGIHLTELRTAVNAVRSCAGLGAASWTDPIINPTETLVQAVHVQEARDNLNSARTTLGLAAQTWTDPTLTVGETEVKKVHFDELRQGVK
ncbi:MAG: hypothetical protein HYX74_12400 [Acidobacteria bacterium]|nr:hypothetical protein [Acidobacteriota bacterium]